MSLESLSQFFFTNHTTCEKLDYGTKQNSMASSNDLALYFGVQGDITNDLNSIPFAPGVEVEAFNSDLMMNEIEFLIGMKTEEDLREKANSTSMTLKQVQATENKQLAQEVKQEEHPEQQAATKKKRVYVKDKTPEQVEQYKKNRLEENRLAAQASRDRKKQTIRDLKEMVGLLQDEQKIYEEQIKKLENEGEILKSEHKLLSTLYSDHKKGTLSSSFERKDPTTTNNGFKFKI